MWTRFNFGRVVVTRRRSRVNADYRNKLAPRPWTAQFGPVMRGKFRAVLLLLLASAGLARAQTPPAAPPPATDDLFKLCQQLFDQLAPPEVKAQFDFPTKEQFDEFAARLQRALEGDDLAALAAYEPEARAALTALRTIPGYEDYADWLEQRLDEISVAREITASPPPTPGPTPAPTPRPTPVPAPRVAPGVPYYDLWLARMRSRPVPARAAALMPRLRAAFVDEGVAPELAWLAEVESSLNPTARSPVGAKGLFQFMPDTAHAMGLGTFMPDDRTDPEKSAHAAARYLRGLHAKFGEWPLAFAAYNAGEGRVSRLLAAKNAKTFSAIASALPAETRMYVPKVCATVAARAGVAPENIASPRRE